MNESKRNANLCQIFIQTRALMLFCLFCFLLLPLLFLFFFLLFFPSAILSSGLKRVFRGTLAFFKQVFLFGGGVTEWIRLTITPAFVFASKCSPQNSLSHFASFCLDQMGTHQYSLMNYKFVGKSSYMLGQKRYSNGGQEAFQPRAPQTSAESSSSSTCWCSRLGGTKINWVF